jgi:hypothetical protein
MPPRGGERRRAIAAIGRRVRVSIPNCQGQLAEWFIGLRGQIQDGIGKSPNRRESEAKRRKAPEAMAKIVEHRLINFIGALERIQQRDVRRYSRRPPKDHTDRGTASPKARPLAPARPMLIQSAASARVSFIHVCRGGGMSIDRDISGQVEHSQNLLVWRRTVRGLARRHEGRRTLHFGGWTLRLTRRRPNPRSAPSACRQTASAATAGPHNSRSDWC